MTMTNIEPVARGQKILVFGSTGVIGKVITTELINCGRNFEIGVFMSEGTVNNKPELVDSFRKQGVEVNIGDINDDSSVLQAYARYDTIVSALGRFAIDKQVDLIRLAESCPNVIRFIPSEYGTDIEYDASSAAEKPHQKKLKVRAFLRTMSRLRYSFIVTGPFGDLYLGNMSDSPQLGSFNVERKEATLLGDGMGRISLISMADVGRAVVAVLLHPEETDNRAVRVNSFTTTPNDILAEFERQTGSKWNVSYTTLEQLKQLEDDAWKNENPLSAVYTLRRIWTEGKTLYPDTDNAAIGMEKMDTLEMAVQEAVSKPAEGFRSGKM